MNTALRTVGSGAPTHTIDPWVTAFRAQGAAQAPWLATLRRDALTRFAAHGWPSVRQDGWRHTPMHAVADAATQWLPAAGLARADTPLSSAALAHAHTLLQDIRPAHDTDHWLVFVDGIYAPQLARIGGLPEGARLVSLSAALRTDPGALEPWYGPASEGEPVMALNTAFAAEGAYLHLAPSVCLENPVHLVFLSVTPGRVRFSRNLLVVEENAAATVVEHFAGVSGTAGLTHTATRAQVGRDARLTLAKLQQESAQTFHLGTTHFAQAPGAQVQSHSLSLGARLARHDIATRFDGKRCHAVLNGLYLLDGKRHVDHHTLIDHAHPDGVSQETYRGILADQSRGVFCGRIRVAPGADRSDAEQRCDSLLLSRAARADAQPELEIYADDVKCAHGATVGQLDEESLFYLRARGLTHADAHSVLVYAFAVQALARITSPALKAHASRAVRAHLPGAGALGDMAWV